MPYVSAARLPVGPTVDLARLRLSLPVCLPELEKAKASPPWFRPSRRVIVRPEC